jgi:lipopolysaccharide transport system ATP-binding protein
MADEVVIRAEGLGKSYMIGHEVKRERYVALRDVFARGALSVLRKTADFARGHATTTDETIEEFWALRDLSFEVKRGEVMGIIGHNGAGKSTLLKILSRITEPTEGCVQIQGRVASLLEVGTGFHPELTGRENIYLNGAILGMRRAEIKRKFDEIVEFAEVEKFLDTPVKRYSSGMYVRLAFAVAAHLEPEILVVDEVLSVGDTAFQQKCLGRMSEVAGGGRTVLFVSHNVDALRRICDTGLLLSQGRAVVRDSMGTCIQKYRDLLGHTETGRRRLSFGAQSKTRHHIIDIELLDTDFLSIDSLATWQPVVFAIRFFSPERTPNAAVTFQISTLDGVLLTFCSTKPDQDVPLTFEPGEGVIYLRFDKLLLSAGKYMVGAGLAIANTKWLFNEPFGGEIEVAAEDVFNVGFAPQATRYPIPMPCRWATGPAASQLHSANKEPVRSDQ